MYSNFITPPDSLQDDSRHTVLIVDADWPEIEEVAFFCKTSKKFYNIHVYRSDMEDPVWLVDQAEKSMVVIINTTDTLISSVKDRLVEQPNAYYYGPKKFLSSSRQLTTPIEYFKQFEHDGNDTSYSV